MHHLAQRRIEQSGLNVEQRIGGGEQLPFPENSFDCVVSTFTLCSVADVSRTLSEIHRVLKPTGRFLLLEHGLSPEPAVQRWQRRLNWLQARLGDGCRLDLDMQKLVAAQPFSKIEIQRFYLEKAPKTHGSMYRGVATK